jgi:hypothetical protein
VETEGAIVVLELLQVQDAKGGWPPGTRRELAIFGSVLGVLEGFIDGAKPHEKIRTDEPGGSPLPRTIQAKFYFTED